MNSRFSGLTVVTVFVAVLAFYLVGFYGLEFLRVRKGPWEVQFVSNDSGQPTVQINQPTEGVRGVKIVFHGERLTNSTPSSDTNAIITTTSIVRFDKVEKNATFGEVIYEDLTFLPGIVTFNLFNHEIELTPRVLVVNRTEIPWHPGAVIDLWPTNKPAVPPKRLPGNRPDSPLPPRSTN